MLSYALPMVRQHLATYGAVLATVIFGTALAGSSLGMFMTAVEGPGLPSPDRRSPEQSVGIEVLESMWGTALFIAAMITVFIVSSTMAFALRSRHRELALLKLVGASSAHIKRLTRMEALILGFSGSVIGAALSIPGTVLLFRSCLLLGDELMPSGLTPGNSKTFTTTALITIAIGVITTLIGAWAPTRRLTKVPPLEAIVTDGTRKRTMTVARWVVGVGCIVGAGLILRLNPSDPDDALASMLGASYVVVIALAALGPVVIPPIANCIGALTLPLWPGAALLAKAQCRWNTGRTSALAVAPILLVTLVGGVILVSETMSGENTLNNSETQVFLFILFGGAVLFTIFNCVLTVFTSAWERRDEFRLLQTTGIGRGQIIGTVLLETCVTIVTSAICLSITIFLIVLKTGSILDSAGLPQTVIIPWTILGGLFGLCAVAAGVSAVGGTAWATRKTLSQ